MSKLVEEFLKENRVNENSFDINSPISSSKDCINAFWYIQEQISIMANKITEVITSDSMRINYPIKESQEQVLAEYKSTTEEILGAERRVRIVIQNLLTYLEQRPDEPVGSLEPACNRVRRNVVLVDDEISDYQSLKGIKPEITLTCQIFFKAITDFNGIIEDFNTHNERIVEENPALRNQIEVFGPVENLRNYVPIV